MLVAVSWSSISGIGFEWRRSHRVLFMVGCGLLGFILFTYAAWRMGPANNSMRRGPDPFSVVLRVALAPPDWQTFSGFWVVCRNQAGAIRIGANVALYLVIVNNQPVGVKIENIRVNIKTPSNTWERLFPVSSSSPGCQPYVGPETASSATGETSFLDANLVGHTVASKADARGWLLFQYPVGFARASSGVFQVSMSDTRGTTFVSDELIASGDEVDSAGIKVSGPATDISSIPLASPGK